MLQDINTIIKISNTIKILNLIKAALTVGIIGFTVFRIFSIIREEV